MLYWNKLLAPIRTRENSSMKRAKNDYRSPFKKDFDTICNSNVLRRLQDKAQVFPLEEGDYARTRLTHSIEVLSIAESLGISLVKEILKIKNRMYLEDEPKSGVRTLITDIPVILMGAALLHDMGNPPFGHLSEQIINDWFKEKLPHIERDDLTGLYEYAEIAKNSLDKKLQQGSYYADLIHFDGNAQLLRLVTKLSLVVDDNGMNLTYPVLASFIKYPCGADKIDKNVLSMKKAGYFSSESRIFNAIVDNLGLRDGDRIVRHPLAFLIEAADDIAYLTADIEDAHHKGIITIDRIEEFFDVYGENSKFVKNILAGIERYRKEAESRELPKKDDYIMHRLRILIKGEMINAIGDVFAQHYDAIMTGTCDRELLSLSEASPLVEAIRDLEAENVYYCKEITESKTRATVIIRRLLDRYVLAALNYDKNTDFRKDTEINLIYQSFSQNYRYICEHLNKQQGLTENDIVYNKLRLVVDQISGMTDNRALRVYQTLTASR